MNGNNAANAQKLDEEIKKEERENRKKKRKKAKAARFKLFLLILAAMALLVFIAFEISLHFFFNRGGDDIKVYIMLETEYDEKYSKETYKLDYEDVFRNGIMYVNISDIAKAFDVTVTGGNDSVKFTVNDDQTEYLTLFPGSSEIVVNGVYARLSHPVIRKNGKLVVPEELISKYVNSVKITFDSDNSKLLIFRECAYDSHGSPVGRDITCKLKQNDTVAPIIESMLPDDIKERIIHLDEIAEIPVTPEPADPTNGGIAP